MVHAKVGHLTGACCHRRSSISILTLTTAHFTSYAWVADLGINSKFENWFVFHEMVLVYFWIWDDGDEKVFAQKHLSWLKLAWRTILSYLSGKEADLVFQASDKSIFFLLVKLFFVKIDFLEDLAHLGWEFLHGDRISFRDELSIDFLNKIMQERFLDLISRANGAPKLIEHKLKLLPVHLLIVILTI